MVNTKDAVKLGGLFAVGVLLFLAVLSFVGFGEILGALAQIYLPLYLAGIGFIVLNIFTWSIRWGLFVKAGHPEVPDFDLFKNLLVGLAINNLTPVFKMGGEAARVYLLKVRNGIKGREGLATVTSDLTIEFIVDAILAIVAMLLLMVFFSPPLWLYGILAVFVVVSSLIVFGIFGLYTGQRIVYRIIEFMCKRVKRLEGYEKRLEDKYETFKETFQGIMKDRKVFTGAVLLTILRKFLSVVKYYVLFAAFGYVISPVNIIIALGISYMLMMVPATPGSLGIIEGGMISVFILLGVPPGIAAAVVFLDRLIWFWGITGVGSMLGTYYGMDLVGSKMIKRYSQASKDI